MDVATPETEAISSRLGELMRGVRHQKLRLASKSVLFALVTYADVATGVCFPKCATLFAAASVDQKAGRRAIAELVSLGLVRVAHPNHFSVIYQLDLDRIAATPKPEAKKEAPFTFSVPVDPKRDAGDPDQEILKRMPQASQNGCPGDPNWDRQASQKGRGGDPKRVGGVIPKGHTDLPIDLPLDRPNELPIEQPTYLSKTPHNPPMEGMDGEGMKEPFSAQQAIFRNPEPERKTEAAPGAKQLPPASILLPDRPDLAYLPGEILKLKREQGTKRDRQVAARAFIREIVTVWDAWRLDPWYCQAPAAARLTSARIEKLADRMEDSTLDELLAVLKGAKNAPAQIETSSYRDIVTIFRDRTQVERLGALVSALPVSRGQSWASSWDRPRTEVPATSTGHTYNRLGGIQSSRAEILKHVPKGRRFDREDDE